MSATGFSKPRFNLKTVFHQAEYCKQSDTLRATEKFELLLTLSLHNFGGKWHPERKIPPSGKQA